MDFDYARAWKELIAPVVEALPADVLSGIKAVLEECKDARQEHDLNIELTDTRRRLIAAIPERDEYYGLAGLSCLIYRYGHWKPSKTNSIFGDAVCWKFSNLVDQVLRKRFELGSYQIHEGLLRATFSSKHEWSWFEVCPAVPGLHAWCRNVIDTRVIRDDMLQKIVGNAVPIGDNWKRIINPMQYGYVEKPDDRYKLSIEFSKLLGNLVYDCKVDAVRYLTEGGEGHPFCIGAKHMRSGGFALDPNAAPCYVCKRPYADHTTVYGLHVWVGFDATLGLTDEFRDKIKSIAEKMKSHELEGIALHQVDKNLLKRINTANTEHESDN